MDAAQVSDYTVGIDYNSAGIYRDEPEERQHTVATLTHYTDAFLGGQHEFKVGVEYEEASNNIDQYTTGITPTTPNGVLFWILPFGDAAYITGLTNYYDRSAARIKRPGAFVQDKATFGRTTWTVGLRYETPRPTTTTPARRSLTRTGRPVSGSPGTSLATQNAESRRRSLLREDPEPTDLPPTRALGTEPGRTTI
jgi:hypothetical protein